MAKNEQVTLNESQIRNIVKASIRESLLKKRAMQRENRINKAVSSVLREMMEEIKPGMSVSHGTGRFIDTIPAMFNVLKQEDPEAAQKILNDNPTFAQMLQKLEDEGESAFNFGQGDPWWESEEAIWVYEDIENELNRLAPEGHYFGSHPGDGSDLGFWPSELDESQDDDEGYTVVDKGNGAYPKRVKFNNPKKGLEALFKSKQYIKPNKSK